MDAFSYLSVLLSIIIGLAITQVLMGYRALLLSRSRVRLYMPTMVWSVLMLVLATQNWWASFGLQDHEQWTFPVFAVILLQTILLYMMSGLVIPDVPPDRRVDLKDHYYSEARPFFGLMIAMLLVSILKDVMLDGELPDGENLAFHAAFGAIALAAFLVRKPRFHEAVAPLMGAAAALYIGLLFARL
jgi:hypothetical protein